MAGCLDSDNGSSPGGTSDDCTISRALGGAPPVDVSVDGTFDEAIAVLDLRWNARTQNSMIDDPDDFFGARSDPDETYLVFRAEVTNTHDEVVAIDEFNFSLEYTTPDVIESVSSTISPIDRLDAEIRPEGTVSGPLPFTIPVDTESAMLRPGNPNFPDRHAVAFRPSCDETLAVDVPEMSGE